MRRYAGLFVLAGGMATPIYAQTTVNGDNLVFQSNGAADGTAWTLGTGVAGNNGDPVNGVGNNSDGYVGTYIQVPTTGTVSISVNAAGVESNSLWPDMTISVAGMNQSFSVNSTNSNTYTATFNLPADTATDANGTYMVRVQLDNQTSTATPDLTVNSVTVNGASLANTSNDTMAMEAAQTYGDKFRSGPGTITIDGANGQPIGAGTAVQVKLIKNAFTFADAVVGTTNSTDSGNPAWLTTNASGQVIPATSGTYAFSYQQAILQNFNAIVPSNAGKWTYNEPTQGATTTAQGSNLTFLDQISQFAQQNDLSMRMHNLIWDSQQPGWVNTLLSNAYSGSTTAKTSLTIAVDNRIGYWLGGTNTVTGSVRAQSYQEADILNEAWHAGSSELNYWKIYGAAGIAQFYNTAARQITASGANTRLYTNEYNVLQYSSDPLISSGPSDPYANWYLAQVQDIRNSAAAQGLTGSVSGIGMELYVNTIGGTSAYPTPTNDMKALQNLSVVGMPLSLNEFGTSSGASFTASTASTILTQTMTMLYGTPDATTMGFWGDLGGPNATGSFLLYNSSWGLTTVGQAFEQWMSQWDTNLGLSTDANGEVNFNGTYGTYEVTVDGQTYDLTMTQGGNNTFTISVPEPSTGALISAAAWFAVGRRRPSRQTRQT